jgi:putative transposase
MDIIDLAHHGKVKRIFRAKHKLTAPDLVSHITQRAAGKEPLFLEDDDHLDLLARLKATAETRALDVYAFCLMPNHIHLLVSPRKDDLQEPMRDLFSGYARRFNRKYERKGHLFAGPYRQAVCLDDGYLLAASVYIHMNPVRAGLVNEPADYRWSSVRLFSDEQAPCSFVKAGFILRLLASEKIEQVLRYGELLADRTAREAKDALENSDAVARFLEMMARVFPNIFSKLGGGQKDASQRGLDALSDGELEERIAAIKAATRPMPPESRKARRFMMEQLVSRGFSRREIAERFGVSVKTVHNILKQSSNR